MDKTKTTITVRLMENDFQLACDMSEREAIVDSAKRLNDALRDFKKNNAGLDIEKVLLMGALSALTGLNKDYLSSQREIDIVNQTLKETLQKLESD